MTWLICNGYSFAEHSRPTDSSSSPVTASTCSKANVHKVIKDDRHLSVTEGMQHHFPLQVLVSGVSGVDSHGRVSQHRLDTGRGHNHLLVYGTEKRKNGTELQNNMSLFPKKCLIHELTHLNHRPCMRTTPGHRTLLSLCNQVQATESCRWAPSYPPADQSEGLIKRGHHERLLESVCYSLLTGLMK